MSVEDQKGVPTTPEGDVHQPDAPVAQDNGAPSASETSDISYAPNVNEEYGYEDPYSYGNEPEVRTAPEETALATSSGSARTPPPTPPPTEDEDEDDDDMLRMSFLEHLEELRSRILKCLMGIGVAFVVSLVFANRLWQIVSEPATIALQNLGFTPKLVQITPMETFSTVWVKLPILTSIFLVSPWILYQVWAFISPGLYKRERMWAAPFVIISAGLFITGGLFAYFVAFRYGLEFLLGIGRDISIQPMVSVTEYFNLFVNVTLGVGLVFELPVLIFFLTLLRVVTPGFLIRNSRYAILVIVVIAAIVTPTPDVFNLMMFAIPMVALFYVGILAGYILVLHREERGFPWGKVILFLAGILALFAIAAAIAIWRFGFELVWHWPFLVRYAEIVR
jgi:sec-independent protein translocase protein TatC